MTTTLPRPPRVPRWARWLLGAFGVGLVAVGAVLAWSLTVLADGLDDLADDGRVQPDDTRVVAAQGSAEGALDAELASLLDGRPEEVLARTSVSECRAGQHNWKVHDDDDLFCVQGASVVLHGQPQRFPDDVLALHEQLLADGWAPAPSHRDRDTDLRGVPAALALDDASPSGAGYLRGDTRLSVVWFQRGDDVPLGDVYRAARWDVPGRPDVSTDQLGTTVPAASHGLALVLQTEYFRE